MREVAPPVPGLAGTATTQWPGSGSMFNSRGAIFGTRTAATHAHSRHELARSSNDVVLLCDIGGASFDVVDGSDVHALPVNSYLAIVAEHSNAIIGVLETGEGNAVFELTNKVRRSMAKSTCFYAKWLMAHEHGVDDSGVVHAYVEWTGLPQSPRKHSPRKNVVNSTDDPTTPPRARALVQDATQTYRITLRAFATLAYAVAPGNRLALLPSKWQNEPVRYGTVNRLFHKGTCIVRLDHGGGDVPVDPRPNTIAPAAQMHYADGDSLLISYGVWTRVRVQKWCGDPRIGNRHTVVQRERDLEAEQIAAEQEAAARRLALAIDSAAVAQGLPLTIRMVWSLLRTLQSLSTSASTIDQHDLSDEQQLAEVAASLIGSQAAHVEAQAQAELAKAAKAAEEANTLVELREQQLAVEEKLAELSKRKSQMATEDIIENRKLTAQLKTVTAAVEEKQADLEKTTVVDEVLNEIVDSVFDYDEAAQGEEVGAADENGNGSTVSRRKFGGDYDPRLERQLPNIWIDVAVLEVDLSECNHSIEEAARGSPQHVLAEAAVGLPCSGTSALAQHLPSPRGQRERDSSLGTRGSSSGLGASPPEARIDAEEHASRRHDLAEGLNALLLFDLDGATFEVTEGDISTVPACLSFPLTTAYSHTVIGTVLANRDGGVRFADRVRFLTSTWFRAAEHGVSQAGRGLLLRLRWTPDPTSPRGGLTARGGYISSRGAPSARMQSATIRVMPNLFYAVKEGVRLAVRSTKRPSELSSGRVVRLLHGTHGGKCVVEIDNGGGVLIVDPRPATVEPASTLRYTAADRLLVLHDGKWRDAAVAEEQAVADAQGSLHELHLTIPAAAKAKSKQDTAVDVAVDLNECNHMANPVLAAMAYEEERVVYIKHVLQSTELVVDTMTTNKVNVKDQRTFVTMSDGPSWHASCRNYARWMKLANVRDLASLLLAPSPHRAQGVIEVLPVLISAPSGAGKTWLVWQTAYFLAERLNDALSNEKASTNLSGKGQVSPLHQVGAIEEIDQGSVVPTSPPPTAPATKGAEAPTPAPASAAPTPVKDTVTTPGTFPNASPSEVVDKEIASVSLKAEAAAPFQAAPAPATEGACAPSVEPPGLTSEIPGEWKTSTQPDSKEPKSMAVVGRSLPLIVEVSALARIITAEGAKDVEGGAEDVDLLQRYVEHKFPGNKQARMRLLLLQAYAMRELVILVDGIDEAAGLREHVESWVFGTLLASGNQLLVTSRPEGIELQRYTERFVVLQLQPLSDEQRWKVLNEQTEGSVLFRHMRTICSTARLQDQVYAQHFPNRELRARIEVLEVADQFILPDGKPNPAMRLKNSAGARVLAKHAGLPDSNYLNHLAHFFAPRQHKAPAGGTAAELAEREKELKRSAAANRPNILQDLDNLLISRDSLEKQADGAQVVEALVRQRCGLAPIEKDSTPLGGDPLDAYRLGAMTLEFRKKEPKLTASALWARIISHTDELYVVAELLLPALKASLSSCMQAAGLDPLVDEDALVIGRLLDPFQMHADAIAMSETGAQPGSVPEAFVKDVLHAEVLCKDSTAMVKICEMLVKGFDTELAAGVLSSDVDHGRLEAVQLYNRFDTLDPSHNRTIRLTASLTAKFDSREVKIYANIDINHAAILALSRTDEAREPYDFFRQRFAQSLGANVDAEMERVFRFLVEATGAPLLFSMLVVIVADGDSLTSLPSSELELYQMATSAAARKIAAGSSDEQTLQLAKDLIGAIAIGNQQARRRDFSSSEADASLGSSADLQQLWQSLVSRGTSIPLLKLVAASSARQAAQYQFVHLSIQEGLYAADLLQNVYGWEGWKDDASASAFLNEQFNQNVCRVGSTALGEALAERGDSWHFEKENGSGLTAAGRRSLLPLLTGNTLLRGLSLTGSVIDASEGAALGECLRSTRSLTDLSLQGARMGAIAGLSVARLIGSSNGSGLMTLNLADTGLGKEGMAPLASALQTHKMLRDLDISWNQLGAQGCAALCDALRQSQSLKSIVMMGEKLDVRAAESIGRALLENTGGGLCFWRSNTVAVLKDMTALNSSGLGPAEVSLLAGLVKHNTTLQTLSLTNGNIGRIGGRDAARALRALATGLRSNAGLTSIDLRGVELGDHAKRMLGNALMHNQGGRRAGVCFSSEGCPELAHLVEGVTSVKLVGLDASTAVLLGGSICGHTSLTHLDVSCITGGRDLGVSIASALRGNPNLPLTHLSLRGSSIGEDGMRAIGNALLDGSITDDGKHIGCPVAFLSCDAFIVKEEDVSLDLSARGALSAGAAVLLAGVLKHNATITTVNVEAARKKEGGNPPLPVQYLKGLEMEHESFNRGEFTVRKLSVASATIIGGLMSTNSTLTKLSLQSNAQSSGNKSLEALLSVLRVNAHSSLRALDLANYGLDEKGAQALVMALEAGKLSQLSTLDISNHRLDLLRKEAMSSLIAIGRPLSKISMGVQEKQYPTSVITTLRSLGESDLDGESRAAPLSAETTSSTPAHGNPAAMLQQSKCEVDGAFVEIRDCDWLKVDTLGVDMPMRFVLRCVSVRDESAPPVKIGMGWSFVTAHVKSAPTEDCLVRGGWVLDDFDVRFKAPSKVGAWRLHVWVAYGEDGSSSYVTSSPLHVTVGGAAKEQEASDSSFEDESGMSDVPSSEPTSVKSIKKEDPVDAMRRAKTKGDDLIEVVPPPMPAADDYDEEQDERNTSQVEVRLTQDTHPWNKLQMKHSSPAVEAASDRVRKKNWVAAQEVKVVQKECGQKRLEVASMHQKIVAQRQLVIRTVAAVAQQSVQQRIAEKHDHGLKVKMEVISWQERKGNEQRAWIDTIKVRVKQQQQASARHEDGGKQKPGSEAAAPDGVSSDRWREEADVVWPLRDASPPAEQPRVSRSPPGALQSPPTPRLAAARKAREEAAKKLKAAKKRADAKRVDSRKKEGKRVQMGALATMLNNFSPDDIVQHATVVVQAVADVDLRVRIAARDAIDRFLNSAGKLKVHPLLPANSDQISLALITKVEDADDRVRQAAYDILMLVDKHCLARNAASVIAYFKHSESEVRLTAVKIIAALERADLIKHADAIAAMLEDQSTEVRRSVVSTMASLDQEALSQLAAHIVGVLSKPELGSAFRRQILSTLLVQIPPSMLEEHHPLLSKYLSTASQAELKAAVKLLSTLPPGMIAPCAKSLVVNLEDQDEEVGSLAATALCKLDALTLQPYSNSFKQRLTSVDWEERIDGLKALAKLAPTLQQMAPDIIACLEDEAPEVRCCALETLRLIKPAALLKISETLMSMLEDEDEETRGLVIDVLNMIDQSELAQAVADVPLLFYYITYGGKDERVRAFAIGLVGQFEYEVIRDHGSASMFVKLLNDPSLLVRRAAVVTTGRFQKELWQYAEDIIKIFSNEKDKEQCKLLLKTLFSMIGNKYVVEHKDILLPHVASALKRLESNSWKARRDAAEVLGALACLTTADHRNALYKLMEDNKFEVSIAASNALANVDPTKLVPFADLFVRKIREAHEAARIGAVKLLHVLNNHDQGLLTKVQSSALHRVGAS